MTTMFEKYAMHSEFEERKQDIWRRASRSSTQSLTEGFVQSCWSNPPKKLCPVVFLCDDGRPPVQYPKSNPQAKQKASQ